MTMRSPPRRSGSTLASMPRADAAGPRPAHPTVLLVEDQAGTRAALAEALRLDGLEVTGAYASGEEAVAALDGARAEVALVDLGLPRLSGVEVIRAVRRRRPDIAVLVLTVFDDAPRVVEAIEAGAQGYLLKETAPADIAAAVTAVRDGHAPLSPEIAGHLLARLRGGPAGARPAGLSDREVEVLTLLARGHAYADIARALGIHLSTVQSHVRNIYRKLEVSSKAEAAALAVRRGMVPD